MEALLHWIVYLIGALIVGIKCDIRAAYLTFFMYILFELIRIRIIIGG